MKFIQDDVTTDGRKWTTERLAGLFGLTVKGLESRWSRSEVPETPAARKSTWKARKKTMAKSAIKKSAEELLEDPEVEAAIVEALIAKATKTDPDVKARKIENAIEGRSYRLQKARSEEVDGASSRKSTWETRKKQVAKSVIKESVDELLEDPEVEEAITKALIAKATKTDPDVKARKIETTKKIHRRQMADGLDRVLFCRGFGITGPVCPESRLT